MGCHGARSGGSRETASRQYATRKVAGFQRKLRTIAAAVNAAQEPAPYVSVVIPAFNEAERIGDTVRAVRAALVGMALNTRSEVIVVDDGSADGTAEAAEAAGGARVIRMDRNRGKGAALTAGLAAARGEVLLMLDADLGASAGECARLLSPVLAGEADMTLARFPAGTGGGGFGLVLRLARWGIRRLTGRTMGAPLSGQRCLTRAAFAAARPLAPGFGVEVALTIDVLRADFRVLEVPTQMDHRVTGDDPAGRRHRARQLRDVARALLPRLLPRRR